MLGGSDSWEETRWSGTVRNSSPAERKTSLLIFHDCGHGSFFPSRKANDIVGFITGVLTFTPYYHWRWEHALHHASSGDLDRRGTDWDYATAALKGSSFYKLPKVLQWFSGSIGFHHIHHLSPRIPNYHLEKCHRAEPLFQTVKPVTLFGSLKSLTFRLWDEQHQRLVGYRALRAVRQQQRQSPL